MKVRVSLILEFDETPDDRGSVDHWVVNTLMDGDHCETDEFMEKYKVEWEEVNPEEVQALTK